ncbi:leukocyte immunoglobulin-like receptor subfamily A member 6 [Cervus elaphus]|uniref:leukocyte immunoglobulin-like receptor subfamily A member 6 n=1 Tax=Cervus elaphus TaxID=9860 RepID=UPI001CC2A860|nr:leukocyte immunoglobulin-like receptor subfamily A member 6 [Cervus elaphus]
MAPPLCKASRHFLEEQARISTGPRRPTSRCSFSLQDEEALGTRCSTARLWLTTPRSAPGGTESRCAPTTVRRRKATNMLKHGCAGARGTRDSQVSPQTSCFHAPPLVTGEHSGPGPLVARLGGAGSPVTIWCQGSLLADVYRLYKESSSESWEAQAPQGSRNKAGFHFEYTRSGDAGQYQCAYGSRNRWSERSDLLPLVVTEAGFDSFTLTKDERLSPPRRLEGQQSPDFPLGRVGHTHGGRYRCYSGHNLAHAWSAPSAPLDMQIAGDPHRRAERSWEGSQGGPSAQGPGCGEGLSAHHSRPPPGMHRKPSLSARPGASVPLGENVTLQCRSEVRSDTFHLSKEGSLAAPQHLRLQDTAPPVQANFTLRAVTLAHGGTYRCYSSQSTAPHLLSLPSDPLELLVSDEERPAHTH